MQIDVYHDNTGDKAQAGGHFYADKAPGASLTAVPAVAAARFLLRALGRDVYSVGSITWLSYVATVTAAGLPAVLAALCVFWISRRMGATDAASAVAAVVCALGTPLWAYGSLLYGHALAAGCLAAAFLGALCLNAPLPDRRNTEIAFATGLAAGWAVVTEFPASIPSALIVAFACGRAFGSGRARFVRATLSIGAGCAASAAVLLTYNWLAFGSLFHIGYASEAGYEGMRTGIFGVTWPNPRVALSLLLGSYRGLLPLAPVLIVCPIGFWILIRNPRTRAAATMAGAIAAYYFLMTAGYAYWDGAYSYGSRHFGPALPFLCLGIAPVWQRAGRLGRSVVLVLALVSVGESLVAVATDPQPPGVSPTPYGWPWADVCQTEPCAAAHPMRELLWPAFASGDFPTNWQSVLDLRPPPEPRSELERRGVPRASWNLGQRVGLAGYASLLPLIVVWIAGLVWWRRAAP